MPKKNKEEDQISSLHSTIDFILKTKEILFSIASIIGAVVAVYVTGKLAPFAKDIAILDQRLSANEQHDRITDENLNEINETLLEVQGDTLYIRGILDGSDICQ